MAETKPPVPPNQNVQPEISYQVMPRSDKPLSQAQGTPASAVAAPKPRGGSKAAYIIISIAVLVIVAGLAYYFLGFKFLDFLIKPKSNSSSNSSAQTSKLPTSFLSQYFAKDTCDDQATCGDNADPDHDGLTNYQEFVAGTSPSNADTDGDGLADGDEVNVYGTNPLKKFTDTRQIAQQNGYDDGVSIKNNYDPLTPGAAFTATRLATISSNIGKFSLHAPTTTTLGLNPDGTQATSNGTSVNPAAGGTGSNSNNSSGNATSPDTTK